ncbi:unannotated protein [freshwater metagenome]|uniref:Unannotated protein n=1 Tax=freshwater metagenome TaxID=449393 RepID=A0A6J7JJP9_9ZZZZ
MERILAFLSVRVRCIERSGVASRGANQLLVERRHDGARANLVDIGARDKTLEHLTVLAAFDIDGDVVTLAGASFSDLEVRVLASDTLELRIDLVIVDRWRWHSDAQ